MSLHIAVLYIPSRLYETEEDIVDGVKKLFTRSVGSVLEDARLEVELGTCR